MKQKKLTAYDIDKMFTYRHIDSITGEETIIPFNVGINLVM